MNVITLPVRYKAQPQKSLGGQKEEGSSGKGARGWGLGAGSASPQAPSLKPLVPSFVGRDTELIHLHSLFTKALHGERQMVFVTGEAGIGKTTLIDAFLAQLRDRADVRITAGQCVEQYGAGEAYLPLLEAFNCLGRMPGNATVLEVLTRHAPTWAVQLSPLFSEADLLDLRQRVHGATRERMLREMADALEALTAECGLILVLEDLHWSDVSTLDLLTYVARRRDPAKLVVIGTYRPGDALVNGHPLHGVTQELRARGHCEELQLTPLTAQHVQTYLAARLRGTVAVGEAGQRLHQLTGGNPLFVSQMVRYLTAQEGGHVTADARDLSDRLLSTDGGIPHTLQQLLERQLERLPGEDRLLLEMASVVGMEFAVGAVAAGLQADVGAVEARCARLARARQFLRAEGVEEWPDGTLGGRYTFVHALYQRVLYERIGAARRIQLHRRIAARKEAAYGDRAGEIAAELAVHFEAGRNVARTIHYLSKAGETAMRRNAHQEAIAHFSRGLQLLATVPDTFERRKQELALQVALGAPLLMAKGYGAAEVAQTYGRARALCQQIGEQPELFPTLVGLSSYYLVRAELQTARELADQCVRLAQHAHDPALLVEAYFMLGVTLFYQGELAAAQAALEQGSMFYDAQAHGALALRYGQDPGVASHAYASLTQWLLGSAEQALGKSRDSLTLARQSAHSYSVGFALHTAAWLQQYRQEGQQLQAYAEEEIRLSQEEGFALWLAVGTILRGWVLSEHGEAEQGIAQMSEGLAALRATGADLSQPYHLALLAQAHGKHGHFYEGLALLDQALTVVDKTGERYYEAELYRLYGQLTLQKEPEVRSPRSKVEDSPEPSRVGTAHLNVNLDEAETVGGAHPTKSWSSSLQVPSLKPLAPKEVVEEAEGYFRKALAIANQQQAKSLELRTATNLARLWQSQGKLSEARTLLEDIYDWFTEGFDTKDLQEAAALLSELGGRAKTERKPSPEFSVQSLVSKHVQSPKPVLSLVEGSKVQSQENQTLDLRRQTLDAHSPTPNSFRSEGEAWTVSFAGTTCRLKDTRGLHCIAHLLQQPYQEVHVNVLVTVSADLNEGAAEGRRSHDLCPPSDHNQDAIDSGEILDPQAKAAYKQRLSELREELAEAEQFHDFGRSEQVAAEIDSLTHELTSAIELRRQTRRAGTAAERARVNITRAIKIALRKISEHHPALGRHLATTIRTGAYCSYRPDVHPRITWQG